MVAYSRKEEKKKKTYFPRQNTVCYWHECKNSVTDQGSGLRCLFDPWIPDPKPIFVRALRQFLG
jgi:hypothetical protein